MLEDPSSNHIRWIYRIVPKKIIAHLFELCSACIIIFLSERFAKDSEYDRKCVISMLFNNDVFFFYTLCIPMVAYFCHHLSDNYVDLLDLYFDLSENIIRISSVSWLYSLLIRKRIYNKLVSSSNEMFITSKLSWLITKDKKNSIYFGWFYRHVQDLYLL